MATPAISHDREGIPDALQRKLDTLPDGPGVYLWKDAQGEVLYVGKAKRLSTRVRSYFAVDSTAAPRTCCSTA